MFLKIAIKDGGLTQLPRQEGSSAYDYRKSLGLAYIWFFYSTNPEGLIQNWRQTAVFWASNGTGSGRARCINILNTMHSFDSIR